MITSIVAGLLSGIVGSWLYDVYYMRRALQEVGEYDADSS